MTPSPLLIAHRANSGPAAARFAAARFTHFELDVRLSEGRVVLSHFQPLARWPARIERDNVRLRLGKGPPFDPPLDEVRASLPPGAVIVFDLKDRDAALRAQLVSVLATEFDDPSRHIVSSRRPADLAAFSGAGFRTWLTLDNPAQIRRTGLRPLASDGVTVRHRALSESAIRVLHEVTDTVVAWTVNDVPRALMLAALGVDGITTDRIAVGEISD